MRDASARRRRSRPGLEEPPGVAHECPFRDGQSKRAQNLRPGRETACCARSSPVHFAAAPSHDGSQRWNRTQQLTVSLCRPFKRGSNMPFKGPTKAHQEVVERFDGLAQCLTWQTRPAPPTEIWPQVQVFQPPSVAISASIFLTRRREIFVASPSEYTLSSLIILSDIHLNTMSSLAQPRSVGKSMRSSAIFASTFLLASSTSFASTTTSAL